MSYVFAPVVWVSDVCSLYLVTVGFCSVIFSMVFWCGWVGLCVCVGVLCVCVCVVCVCVCVSVCVCVCACV